MFPWLSDIADTVINLSLMIGGHFLIAFIIIEVTAKSSVALRRSALLRVASICVLGTVIAIITQISYSFLFLPSRT